MSNTSREVEIRSHQVEHYRRLVSILENNFAYFDNSDTGTGKTPMTLAMAQTFNWPIMVVALKSSLEDWRTMANKYNVTIKAVINYSSLQGITGKQPKHGLLSRSKEGFAATNKFRRWVKKGLFLVFDEIQKAKNDTSHLASCHALVKCVVEEASNGADSRVALLSATPIDKIEQYGSLFKMMGIVSHNKLYTYDRANRHYDLLGLEQVFNYCENINPSYTRYMRGYSINRTNINKICQNLYINVIKKHLSSAMPPIKIQKDAKNGYYDFEENDLIKLKEGIDMLSSAINFNKDTNNIGKTSKWGDVVTALTIIEKAKVNTMVRLAKGKLDEDPNCKVILYFRYLDNINDAHQKLLKYGALYINGSKTEQERKLSRNRFQADSNDYRVLISNSQVSGIGVELDDQHGNHKRYMFMIADYRLIDSHQNAGRIGREGTRSIPTIRFVYSKKYPFETSIIHAMLRKSKVLREVIIDDKNDILLPGEYMMEIEGVDNIDLIKDDPIYKSFQSILNLYTLSSGRECDDI